MYGKEKREYTNTSRSNGEGELERAGKGSRNEQFQKAFNLLLEYLREGMMQVQNAREIGMSRILVYYFPKVSLRSKRKNS